LYLAKIFELLEYSNNLPSINFINFIIGGCSKSRTTRENEDMVHAEKKEQAKISK
jgi:hypothetical protein